MLIFHLIIVRNNSPSAPLALGHYYQKSGHLLTSLIHFVALPKLTADENTLPLPLSSIHGIAAAPPHSTHYSQDHQTLHAGVSAQGIVTLVNLQAWPPPQPPRASSSCAAP